MPKYKCSVCDYIYDEAANENIPFEKQSEVFNCPECGAWKDDFKPS